MFWPVSVTQTNFFVTYNLRLFSRKNNSVSWYVHFYDYGFHGLKLNHFENQKANIFDSWMKCSFGHFWAGAAEDVGEAVAGAAEDAGEWIAGAAEDAGDFIMDLFWVEPL